jgi:crotonobetaine/carnitine-CoA ligase
MATPTEHIKLASSDDLLPQIIARGADEQPDAVFLRSVEGEVLTYRDLHREACIWAAAYRRLGVGDGENVALMTPMCLDYYRSWFGLSWLKAVMAPLNTDYRGQLLIHAISTVAARVVVSSRRFLDRIADVADKLHPELTVVVLDDDKPRRDLPFSVVSRGQFLDGVDPLREPDGPGPWDTATILYTSGTTGPSKAVVVPWAQLHRASANSNLLYRTEPGDVFYAPTPTYHLGAVLFVFQAGLANASTVVRERFSAQDWWADVANFGCTRANFIGALVAFATGSRSTPLADNPIRSVMMVPVPPDVDEFQERFGLTVGTAYGSTEVGCPISTAGIDLTSKNHATCGRQMPGFEVRIVDEHDIEVPTGEVGQAIVRAERPWLLNQGYFSMPEQSREAWRNGWFHTGDAMRKDDEGYFYFVDRMKDCIRRRGENISSFEVETAILDHPEVRECAAIAVPSELSEDEVKVVIVREDGSELGHRDLIEWLAPRMPRFMIPRYVEYVAQLPKTPNDRVRKAALRDQGNTDLTWDRESAGVALRQ